MLTCDGGDDDDVTQAVDRRRVESVHPAVFILIGCNAMPFSDIIMSSLFS
jgi:hypothetical protein